MKADQERERHQRAEEKFKEWLARANEKSRANPKSPCHPKKMCSDPGAKPHFSEMRGRINHLGFMKSISRALMLINDD